MKLTLTAYKCANQHFLESANLSSYCYGEFLLRSEMDEVRYLNAIGDKVFDEVEMIVALLARKLSNSADKVKLLHAIFGEIACNPDSAGRPFTMNFPLRCPSCGPHDMAAWDIAEPPQAIEVLVAPVTHEHWSSLGDPEKNLAVKQSVEASLSTSRQCV